MNFTLTSKCSNCNKTIRGRSKKELELELLRHMYKKHKLVYSIYQNYSKIENDMVVTNINGEK